MTNFGAKILSNAVSGLQASQARIAVAGNNIANVNTPGYARRTVELQTRISAGGGSGINVGSGVEIGNVSRINDRYLDRVLQDTIAKFSGYQIESNFLQRIQGLFSLTGDVQTIGSSLNAFFASAQDLAVNPASIELRANFLTKAQDLVSNIRTTFSAIANLQDEANRRLVSEVGVINGLTSQIATLNASISGIEGNGVTAADQRDQRDRLLQKLAEKISFQTVEQDNGTVNVFLANGFPLVAESTARNLEFAVQPSFASGSVPPSLSGGTLGYIVYNYAESGPPAHVDLTQVISRGEGEVGGLLRIRGTNAPTNTSAFQASGALVEVAVRIEAIARTLLTTVNETYLGGDRDPLTPGVLDPSSYDLNGDRPNVYGLFDFEPATGTPKDANGNGVPDDIGSGALGIDSFAARLTLSFSDPRQVAAALNTTSGAFVPSGLIAPGDGRNIEAIAALQRREDLIFSVGSVFALTASFDAAYNETVTRVGALGAASEVNRRLSEGQMNTAMAQREQVVGVSLDEEFTILIQSQRVYQASARLLRIADELLQQVVNVL